MAQTKKTTGRSSANGKKKNKTAGSGKSRSASAAEAKRRESTLLGHAAPYIVAAVAVLIAVCMITGEGKVGVGVRDMFAGLFSGAAYALPVFMLVRAVMWKRDDEEDRLAAHNASAAGAFILLAMLLQMAGGGDAAELDAKRFFEDGVSLIGGGAVGGVLGELMCRGFGKVCSVIITSILALILALYGVGITPKGVFIRIAYGIRFAGEKREEKRAAKEEKLRERKPTRNQIKEEEYLEYLREKRKRPSPRAESANDGSTEKTGGKKNALASLEERQEKIVPAPQVYKVKRRRLTEMDVNFDDGAGEEDGAAEQSLHAFTDESADNTPADSDAAAVGSSDENVIDERIFDEVMRRTRERIEKGKRTDDLRADTGSNAIASDARVTDVTPCDKTLQAAPEYAHDVYDDFSDGAPDSYEAGDVLDAVENAVYDIENGAHPASSAQNPSPDAAAEAVPSDAAKNAQTETDSVKLAVGDGFDAANIFVNPEDAELIDKLSEAYKNDGLNVKREQVAKLQSTEKPQKPSAPVYKFPPIDLLTEDSGNGGEDIKDELQDNAVKLVETLRSFNVKTKIENISRGPTITRYELLPEPGTRVRSIVNLVDDIALNLATTGVRIEAPIPGKSAVGIEVPNKNQATVHLRTLIESKKFVDSKSKLTVCLGEDVAGEAVYCDISKMPHLLIAGTTGSGKSVCINSIIMSILYKASPADVKLILIDPKKVELSVYNGVPHLLVPVISETKKAAGSLSWAVGEMERRYGLIEAVGVRDINAYNKATENDPDYEYMERIVIIIDELADFMLTAPDDVEESICRLAQKARAAGMHLILGTQRPSVNVITGLIKANIPSRIAFTVTNRVDSGVILDRVGAESLIGRGDMLYNPVGALKPIRVQGAFVSEDEVEDVVSYIKNMNSDYAAYSDEVENQIEREAQKCTTVSKKGAQNADDDGEEEDPMLTSAIELAVNERKISTSLIQRRLSLGYGRAAKLIDRMESLGYVSPPDGQKPREVLITKQEFMEMRLNNDIG